MVIGAKKGKHHLKIRYASMVLDKKGYTPPENKGIPQGVLDKKGYTPPENSSARPRTASS